MGTAARPGDEVMLSPRQLQLLSTAEVGQVPGSDPWLSGGPETERVAQTLVRDRMVERLNRIDGGRWAGALTPSGVRALEKSAAAALADVVRRGSRLSWAQVAEIIGRQMANHAHCPTHIGLVAQCPFCDDRVAYATYAGRSMRASQA